jgi:hypothetical protein
MAASAATSGFGATFAYLSTDPSTYTSLAEVLSITPPSISVETIESTHMASDDTFREYIAGLRDGGEVTVTMNYVESSATLLQTLVLAGSETFKITLAGGSTLGFSGIPTEFAIDDIAIDDKMTMSLTVKVSGKPVYTAV